jgi:flagellar biogenesis protein FliO
MEFPVPMTEPVFVEEQQVVAYPVSESEAEGINAWWMFLAIAFIILLGFGAGYLVVRPLFEHHTR